MTTKINKLFLLCCLFLSLGIVNAQPSNYQFFATAPQTVSNVTASVVGQQGQGSTYYYWVVAEYPIGMSLAAGPGIATNAAITLSVSNYNRVNWVGQTGATGYTVLRTSTNTSPFNAGNTCTCAVVVGTGSTTVDDVGAALSSFTLTPATSALGSISLNNRDFAVPTLVFAPSVLFPDAVFVNASFTNLTATNATIGTLFATTYLNLPVTTGFFDKATFVLCNEDDCAVDTDITNAYIVIRAGTLQSCRAFAKVAPVGADLIIDILNTTSIFGGGTKLVIADGAQTGSQATFALPTVAVDDLLTVNIDQIGSGTPGQTVTVVCDWTFTN